tara:strand:- start:3446 stop:3646 length:201 start_codon:yes stop_codon:yes gene_type:complete
MGNKVTPKEYLDMWLSEQIPLEEWIKLLNSNPKIEECYKKHVKEENMISYDDIITLDDLEPKKEKV